MIKNSYRRLDLVYNMLVETDKTNVNSVHMRRFRYFKVSPVRLFSHTCLPLAKSVCCLLFIAFVLFATGCGYTIHGKADLPFQSVGIGKIINKTFEPKLEDRLQRALVDELETQGFVIDNSSDHKIDGTITSFTLSTLSEKSGVAVEYEVVIKGSFKLIDPSGKPKDLRNHGVFIVSFPSVGALQNVVALKEQATEKALRDLSSELVASIMYSGPTGK